ncbi:MAG: DUF455 family protein [Planctomycetota bacterium]
MNATLSIPAWCERFLRSEDAAVKLAPAPTLDGLAPESWPTAQAPLRVTLPGRPAQWQVQERSAKTPKAGAMVHPEKRAQLLHTLAHHELQAAEMFAWALLAFPETPLAFRQGLWRLLREELGHLALYLQRLAALGTRFGDEPVRDWFWSRLGSVQTPVEFVAFLGLGLEGANLEHAQRFSQWMRAVGDEATASVLDQVERDEIGHVRFALHWYREFSGGELRFEDWTRLLPEPLSPLVFRGRPLNLDARRAAGYPEPFLDRLAADQEAP